MKRKISVPWLMICLISLLCRFAMADDYSNQLPKSQCGINSLYFCLNHFGVRPSFAKLYEEITPNAENQVSLKQLADYARTKGLFVIPIKKPSISDIRKSLQSGGCVILQWSRKVNEIEIKHIMPIIDVPGKGWLIFDFPINKIYASEENLLEYVNASDAALIVSSDKKIFLNVGINTKHYFGPLLLLSLLAVAFFVYRRISLRGKIGS